MEVDGQTVSETYSVVQLDGGRRLTISDQNGDHLVLNKAITVTPTVTYKDTVETLDDETIVALGETIGNKNTPPSDNLNHEPTGPVGNGTDEHEIVLEPQ